MGAEDAAPAIAAMTAALASSTAVTAMAPDDEQWPGPPEAAAFKLGLFALVRLRSTTRSRPRPRCHGRPVSTWWPVAYALQRIGGPRASAAPQPLIGVKGRYTPAFAARGLGRIKDRRAADPAAAAARSDGAAARRWWRPRSWRCAISASRRPARAWGASLRMPRRRQPPDRGGQRSGRVASDRPAADRAGSHHRRLAGAAGRGDPRRGAIDPEASADLSGLEIDRHWLGGRRWRTRSGRCPESGDPRLDRSAERRGQAGCRRCLRALVRLQAPDVDKLLLAHLKEADYAVREAAGGPAGGVEAGRRSRRARAAYSTANRMRPTMRPRRGDLGAGGVRDAGGGRGVRAALADKDWAVRVRAAELLRSSIRRRSSGAIRPVPGAPTRAVRRSDARRAADLAARVHRDGQGHHRVRARGARCAADGAQLHGAGAQGLLQRAAGAPRGAELRRAGRRSARRRRRRARLHDSRRAQRAAVPARHGGHGARRGATPAAASSSSRTHRSRTSTPATRRSATS